jgi:tRNA dimethylallyltransferase
VTLAVIVVVGPTASGKTWLGVQAAHRLGSEIISADSRQVYRDLDLGTGKDLHEYSSVSPPVPYHLIDIADPRDIYTLFDYQRDCFELLRRQADREPFRAGAVPMVMVGGSGLYVEAVIREYPIADVPEDPELRRRLMAQPHAVLVDRLQHEDPDLAARTDLQSTKRVVRALEIVAYGGSAAVASSEPLGIDVRYTVYGVRIDRDELRRRIATRVDERIEQGMVDEVRNLIERGLSFDRLEMLGLEYREIGSHLRGDVGYDEMVSRLKLRIGQLAKRQETYFRGMERRGVPIRWIDPRDLDAVVSGFGAWRVNSPGGAR